MNTLDYVLEYMKKNNIPLTKANYREIQHFGQPQEDWEASEIEEPLPPELQDDDPPDLADGTLVMGCDGNDEDGNEVQTQTPMTKRKLLRKKNLLRKMGI